MNMLNQCIIEGIVMKPKMDEQLNGNKVLSFKIETKRYFKLADGKTVSENSYFKTVCYGRMAELYEKYIKDKKHVRIVGRIKEERWQDETGKQHSEVVILAEHIEMIYDGVTK